MTGIGSLQSLFGTNQTQQTNGVGEGQAAGTTSGTSQTQQIDSALLKGQDLSTVSSTAGALKQGLDGDDVRMDKVAQLKSAIDSGNYSVSSSDVADKLMQSMLGGN